MNYLEETADRIQQLVPADLLPPDSEALLLMYAVLARAKGTATTSEDVHDAWTAWMLMRGKRHRSIRAFDDLPAAVRAEDEPFAQAIRQAASEQIDSAG